MRVLFDPNIIISALLAPTGAPARLVNAWQHGAFELVVSPLLLAELERALAYPKLRGRIDRDEAAQVVEWLRRSATVVSDPAEPTPPHSADPGDDYLLALAASERAAIVSGDAHLLALADELPIFSATDVLALLAGRRRY